MTLKLIFSLLLLALITTDDINYFLARAYLDAITIEMEDEDYAGSDSNWDVSIWTEGRDVQLCRTKFLE